MYRELLYEFEKNASQLSNEELETWASEVLYALDKEAGIKSSMYGLFNSATNGLNKATSHISDFGTAVYNAGNKMNNFVDKNTTVKGSGRGQAGQALLKLPGNITKGVGATIDATAGSVRNLAGSATGAFDGTVNPHDFILEPLKKLTGLG